MERLTFGASDKWAKQKALVRYFQGFSAKNTECENDAQYTPGPTAGACDTAAPIHVAPPSGSVAVPSRSPSGSAPISPWVVGTTPPGKGCDTGCPEKPGVPAQVYRPFRSKEIRASTQQPVVVSDGLFFPVVRITVPTGYNAVINLFGQGAPFPAAFADIQWRITVDGLPQFGLDNIRSQQGTVVSPAEVLVMAIERQTIALQAQKLTPGNVLCDGFMSGWIFLPHMNVGVDHWQGWMGY